MAEFNLLSMVQNILSRMSSDEVNSIEDTTESLQVANIIQNKYYDMVARGDLPEFTQLVQLDASGRTDLPTLMYVPDQVSKIHWIKYYDTNPADSQTDQFGAYSHDLNVDLQIQQAGTNVPTGYRYVNIIPVDQFLDMTDRFDLNESNVSIINFSEHIQNFGEPQISNFPQTLRNFTFKIKKDRQPMYCAILSNYHVVFDSYDQTQDDTLQSSKTECWADVIPDFQLVDTYIPPLDDQQFPLLLNEATALAFLELKQMPHPKADQEIRRGWSYIQKKKATVNKPSYFDQIPSFGRVPRTGGYGSGDAPYRWMRQL